MRFRIVVLVIIFCLGLSVNFLKAEKNIRTYSELSNELDELLEEYDDSLSLKIIYELLYDEQFQIQLACYALIGELADYKENISDPFLLFTVLSTHDNPLISGCAARALGKIGDKRAVLYLVKLIKDRKDNFVVESSVLALGDLKVHDKISLLSEFLNDETTGTFIQEAIVKSIVKIEEENSIYHLITFLEKPVTDEKQLSAKLLAIGAIGLYENKENINILSEILNNSQNHIFIRLASARELMNIKDRRAKLVLEKFYEESKEFGIVKKIKTMNSNDNIAK